MDTQEKDQAAMRAGTIGMASKHGENPKHARIRREAEKMIRTGNAVLAALDVVQAEYEKEDQEAGK